MTRVLVAPLTGNSGDDVYALSAGTGQKISLTGGNVVDAGVWAVSTTYALHTIVSYGNTEWRCTTAHTSTSTFDDTKWAELNQYRGPWQASTRYEVGDALTNSGTLYQVTTAFTSPSTFTTTNLSVIAGGSTSSVLTPTAVQTGTVSVAAGQLALLDLSQGPVIVQAPNAPADKSQWGYKNLYTTVSTTLTTALTSGTASSLAVSALRAGIPSTGTVTVVSGTNSQSFGLSSAAAAGATTIATSATPTYSFPIGSTVTYAPALSLTIQTQGSDVFDYPGGTTSSTPAVILNAAKVYQYEVSALAHIAIGSDLSVSQLDNRYTIASAVLNVLKCGPKGSPFVDGSYALTAGGSAKVGDGSGTTLNAVYASLTAAQATYPFATALTQTVDYCAIQLAVNTLGNVGGGRVLMPGNSTYVLSTSILPISKVDMIGEGWTTLLQPNTSVAAIYGVFSFASPLSDCTFRDFAIDGTNQGATYNVTYKGIFCQYLLRCNFNNLRIANTIASGLGIDYLQDCTISSCDLVNCGRLWTTGATGGAGIGIGTGILTSSGSETWTVEGCHAEGCGSYGIFAETQPASATINEDCAIIGNTVRACNKGGIGVSGGQGMVVNGNICDGNGTSGTGTQTANITIDLGTLNKGGAAYTNVVNNTCINGLAHGILVTGYSGVTTPRRLKISDNVVTLNGSSTSGHDGYGIYLNGTAHALTDFTVSDNIVALNYSSGIILNGGTGHTNIAIRDNDVYGNGRAGGAADGINVSSTTVAGLQIVGNQSYNQTSGTQVNGINLASTATISQLHMQANDVRGNTTGAIVAAALTTAQIINNPGYNPVGASSITPGASPYTYTAGPTPETVSVAAGTVTQIAVGNSGSAVNTGLTTGSFDLSPGQVLTVTYSVAPTMVTNKH